MDWKIVETGRIGGGILETRIHSNLMFFYKKTVTNSTKTIGKTYLL